MAYPLSRKHREELTRDEGRLLCEVEQARLVKQSNDRKEKILGTEHSMNNLVWVCNFFGGKRACDIGIGCRSIERSFVLPPPVYVFFHLLVKKLRMVAIAWTSPVDVEQAAKSDLVIFRRFKFRSEIAAIEADETIYDHPLIQNDLELLMSIVGEVKQTEENCRQ